FFWIFLAIELVAVRHDGNTTRRVLRAHAVVGAVALAAAYLTTKLMIHVIGVGGPNSARSTLVHDIPGKVSWFVRGPLYHSLSLFGLTPSPWVAVPVAVVATGGVSLAVRRERLRPLPVFAVGAALIPLSFLPNLVVSENSPTFRVQMALTSLVALYASLGALSLWLDVGGRLDRGSVTASRF